MPPMDISELRLMVGHRLSGRSLKACAQVCKAWHATFNPLVWSFVSVRPDLQSPGHSPIRSNCRASRPCSRCDWREAFAKYGHYVRHLTVHCYRCTDQPREIFEFLVEKCTSLVTVTQQGYFFLYLNMGLLLQRNPSIYHVSTQSSPYLRHTLSLPNLRSLEYHDYISFQDVLTILVAVPQLQELFLPRPFTSTSTLGNWDISSQTHRPSSLKKLTLPKRYDETDIAPILQRCPKLEYLDLGGLQGVSNSTLQLLLQPDLLSRLVSLAFHRDSEPQAIKQVLRALSRPPWIRHLRITDPTPATLALIAEHHGKHLEHLVLDEVDCSLCSPMTLLTQCSALKTFKFISDNFLPLELRTVVGSPWGCLQLEELDMSATLQHEALVVPLAWQATAMVGQQAGTEAQPRRLVLGDDVGLPPPPPMPLHRKLAEMAFMERLGSLKQLRRLRLRAWPSDYAKSDVMTWELTSGLDQLQHLTRLEVLEIGNRPYRQGVNEILWMRAHWTSLLKLVVYRLEAQQKEWFRIYWPELTVVEGGICDR